MPDIGSFHPQLVHFVVGFGLIGVAFRLISFTGRLPWTSPAATSLLVLAALASVAAAQAGDDAHEVAEQIPGVRQAVQDHEDLGEDTRDLFLVVGALELLALILRKRARVERGLLIASGIVGVVAAYFLYEAGEHGGRLVYSYAGGVGTRTGDTADVHRLLVAGLYQEAEVMRNIDRPEEAARLTDELARQLPGDPGVTFLVIESILRDRHDAAGALAAIAKLPPPPADDPRRAIHTGLLQSEALIALGRSDSARAVLMALQQRFPDSRRLTAAIGELK